MRRRWRQSNRGQRGPGAPTAARINANLCPMIGRIYSLTLPRAARTLPRAARTRWVRVLMVALALGASPAAQSVANHESDFLTRIRRLTVEGRRAGEGYWSPDGKKLVFQSEREPGNPFYQIYSLDLTTGDTKRISPGYGKTTCSFFRPGTDEIEFASTHHDATSKKQQQDELDFRASGKTRRYSWDYDPEFDIYVYKPGAPSERGGPSGPPTYTRLTNARGYDAEG